jgi:hypothetical protein
MVFTHFLEEFTNGPKFKSKIDFFCDRLFHLHTPFMMLAFMGATQLKGALQSPINCWIPKELDRYSKYMTKLCWLKGTYYLPMDVFGNVIDERLYDESENFKKEALITYYQWIGIILLLQAFMFYFPYVLWSFMANRSTFELNAMVEASNKYDVCNYPRERIFKYLKSYFERSNKKTDFDKLRMDIQGSLNSSISSRKSSNCFISLLKKLTPIKIYLHSMYLLTKFLYFSVVLVQLMLINAFLSSKTYKFNAFDSLRELVLGHELRETSVFPRIVQCDLNIGHEIRLDRSHEYSIRCILPLNMFVEKIYIFLYVWCVALAIFVGFDLVKWSHRFVNFEINFNFIKYRVKLIDTVNGDLDKRTLKVFINDYLGHDGVFVMRLIEKNSNIIVSQDLLRQLWFDFYKFVHKRERKTLCRL